MVYRASLQCYQPEVIAPVACCRDPNPLLTRGHQVSHDRFKFLTFAMEHFARTKVSPNSMSGPVVHGRYAESAPIGLTDLDDLISNHLEPGNKSATN